MTIQEAIELVDMFKDNQYSQEQKIKWLSDIDGLVNKEIILTHEGAPEIEFTGYDDSTDVTTVLLVPFPYSDVYRWFLESRIDLSNGETAKYNNSVAMYNNAYLTYTDYYNRTHMPVQKVPCFRM